MAAEEQHRPPTFDKLRLLMCRLRITGCVFASGLSQSVDHLTISITYRQEVTRRYIVTFMSAFTVRSPSVFTTGRYASVVHAMALCLCLSVTSQCSTILAQWIELILA